MPIIPTVGRRSWKLRLVLITLYLVATLGAITVVYPFALMVSLGFTTEVDYPDYKLIPAFVRDDGVLFKKFIANVYMYTARTNGQASSAMDELNYRYGTDYYQPVEIEEWYNPKDRTKPSFDPGDKRLRLRVTDWNEFRRSLPPDYFDVCKRGSGLLLGPSASSYADFMRNRYSNNIDLVNYAYGQEYDDFVPSVGKTALQMHNDALMRPDWFQLVDLRAIDWYVFKVMCPAEVRQVTFGRPDFRRFLLEKCNLGIYDNPEIQCRSLKARYGLEVSSYRDIRLPRTMPTSNPQFAKDWLEFVRTEWPARYVRATGGRKLFASYLRAKYGTVEKLNSAYATDYRSFDDPGLWTSSMPSFLLQTFDECWSKKVLASPDEVREFRERATKMIAPRKRRALDWADFVKNHLPPRYIQLADGEHLYSDFLAKRYGSVATVNARYGTHYKEFDEILPPYKETDLLEVWDRRKELRRQFLTQNFVAVFKFIAIQGRALRNTAILVFLTIATHLTISPLCAFVLSRFRLPYTYKILLFLIATMAFPGEVAAVPNFLMLKHLHLFNTYWALILPGLANGFGIFILKSFFDSLPEELFEAARIDGAGDLRQFYNVALPLTKPIFAVNALGSFTAAYGGFMWAFLVCRDPKMWTLMVYLYQFQVSAGSPSLMMASLVIASLPILLMFVCCQQVILRGIVLPSFK